MAPRNLGDDYWHFRWWQCAQDLQRLSAVVDELRRELHLARQDAELEDVARVVVRRMCEQERPAVVTDIKRARSAELTY